MECNKSDGVAVWAQTSRGLMRPHFSPSCDTCHQSHVNKPALASWRKRDYAERRWSIATETLQAQQSPSEISQAWPRSAEPIQLSPAQIAGLQNIASRNSLWALKAPACSCWVCKEWNTLATLHLGHFSGLYLQWANLKDEVTFPSGTKSQCCQYHLWGKWSTNGLR